MENTLTMEQVVEQYRNVRLRFSSYYKYLFTFKAVASDGIEIVATYGGSSEDIYRYNLKNDQMEVLGEKPNDTWSSVSLYRGDEEIFSWWDSY